MGLIALLIVVSFDEIVRAWELLGRVNLWILSLFIPVVFLNYFAAGETILSYLRQKKLLKNVSRLEEMRIMLELNFVNHALPSGGASGISYMTWRLTKLGVSASKAATAQVVRLVTGFAAFAVLLAVAVIAITIDGEINRWILLVSSTLAGGMFMVTVVGIYFIKDKKRMRAAATWISRTINRLTWRLTRGKKRVLVREEPLVEAMSEMHDDYVELVRNKKLLKRPFWWGVVFIMSDVMLFVIAFWALGTLVNPAPVLIAFGLATLAGFAVVTPGGSGAYEALMVSFLAIAGLTGNVAIAGVLLTRVIVLLVILCVGYVFYQHSIIKYGKPSDPAKR